MITHEPRRGGQSARSSLNFPGGGALFASAGAFLKPLSGGASHARENHGDVVRTRKRRLWPYRVWAHLLSAAHGDPGRIPSRHRSRGGCCRIHRAALNPKGAA